MTTSEQKKKNGLPQFVLNRNATEKGEVFSSRRCSLEGCTGRQLGVRWPDKSITWPCTKGMRQLEEKEDTWQIAP